MKEISLTQGKVALVDDTDYGRLSQWKWCVGAQTKHITYAMRKLRGGQTQYMHRLILGLERGDGKQVDHADGDGLNNQIANLRICTVRQNHQNTRKRNMGGVSKYKGVYRSSRHRKWYAQIKLNGRGTSLGSFSSEREAARAYNKAASKFFGEFARLNTF